MPTSSDAPQRDIMPRAQITAFLRPADNTRLVGDATRTREVLGRHLAGTFEDIVDAMVEHDLELLG